MLDLLPDGYQVRLTHVACPGIQEEDRALGNGDSLVGDILDGGARKC